MEQRVEVGKWDSCPQRSSFFLSEWVRLTFEKFLQGPGLREFEQKCQWVFGSGQGWPSQLGGSHQRNSSLFLH